MSWLRLLAAGKSLVGLKDTVSRYRVRDRLPVFRRSDHPFRATTLPSKSAAVPVESDGRTAQPAPRPGREGGSAVEKGVGDSGPLRRIAARLFTSRPKTAYESRLSQPVQTELALDRVRVVRNDLTDEDVEVVRTHRTVKAAPTFVAQPEGSGSALETPADRGAILKC